MKKKITSFTEQFNDVSNKNPKWSSYICFAEAIRGQVFSGQKIHRYFRKFVDKSDYDKNTKKELFENLGGL